MTRPIKSISSYAVHQAARKGVLLSLSFLILIAPAIAVNGSNTSERTRLAKQGQDGRVAVAQQENAQGLLELGKPVSREIAGGEIHSYKIALSAGQFLRLVVEQQGINVFLSLYDPNGKKIADLDSPVGSLGSEPASLIADVTGTYRLDVRPWRETAPRGRYEAKIEEVRIATTQDKLRIAGERTFAEAAIISGQGTGEAWRKSIEKYSETLPTWQALGDRKQEAFVLTVIGHTHNRLSERGKALDYYQRALTLRKATGDRSGEALLLYLIGNVHDWLGEPQKSLAYYDQALAIQKAVGDRSMVGSTLSNMGAVYFGLGEYRKALEFFNQTLLIKREIKNPPDEATVLNNIGLVYHRLGELQKALEFYNQAIPILRAIGDRSGEGTTLNNIGTIYDDLGDTKKALEFHTEVVQIKRDAGNRTEEAIALSNVGFDYIKLGENRKALEFLNQSLLLSQAAGARASESTALGNIGRAYANLGEHRKALEYFNKAMVIQVDVGDRRGQGVTLVNIGRAYQDLGDPAKALEFHNQSLPLRRALADRNGEAATLYNIARSQRDLNNLGAAREAMEQALAAVESLRINVRSPQLRTSYFASVRRYYEFNVDVLMSSHKQQPGIGFDALALEASEKGRARSLLELLKEGRAEIRYGLDASLIEREGRLRNEISAKAERHTRLLAGKPNPSEAAAMEKEIDALATEYEQVQGQIRQASPRYAALTQPVPLGLKEIQTQILDPDTLLLEYALSDERSYLWAVTPTSSRAFELPKRQEIEAVARELYEALTARNQTISGETPEQRRQRLARADADYEKKATALSEIILRPVAAELKSKRLLIVSEGALQYVPFAALPEPLPNPSERAAATFKPLVFDHEIVSLPSASVLAVLRQETTDRKPPSKTLAVLADPVFTVDDPRVVSAQPGASPAIKETSSSEDVKRSATESGSSGLVRLRFSRLEAEEISKFAPDRMKLKAVDFAASRNLATNEELSHYRIVHFATHGLINNQHPELSGIVLSLVDNKGQPQNGFLRLYDIYNLKLSADLVVLSACQTALGKDIRGEGLVGLTRGFMYAGAPRVVASLWRVDDRASAQLMQRFYARMTEGGLPPAAALRAAEVSMLREKRWQAPYYWAAFTLQGEWK